MSTTILTSADAERLNKTIYKDGRYDSYQNAFKFFHFEAFPTDIRQLSELLTALENEDTSCIVRGAVSPAFADQEVIRRRLYDDYGNRAGELAERATGCPWIMFDFDAVEAPNGIRSNDDRLAYLISLLPEAFADVSYHYQWSASAGRDGWKTLSAHLWFWIAAGCRLPDTKLRERAEAEGWKVDLAPLNAAQVHYTAAPHFVDGPDPLEGQRSGFVERSNAEVTLAPWRRPVAPKVSPTMARMRSALRAQSGRGQAAYERHLSDIGQPNYNAPILRSIAAYAAAGGNDQAYILDRVRDAIEATFPDQNRRRHYLSNQYLNWCYRQAQKKFGK